MIVIRAFIAIDFDKELKNSIYELQQKLRRYSVKGRWKHSDNFHLTLKFLDEITPTQQEKIDGALENLCISRKPFNLTVTEMGVFDGRDAIRVLWLGLGGDTGELMSLQKEVDKVLAPLGFPPERRSFSPHITIGQDIAFDCSFEEIRSRAGGLQLGTSRVNSLILFKSEQVQNRRIYTRVSEHSLLNK